MDGWMDGWDTDIGMNNEPGQGSGLRPGFGSGSGPGAHYPPILRPLMLSVARWLARCVCVSLSRSRFARVAVAEWRPIMNARIRIASSLFYLRQTHPAPLTFTYMFSAQF
jgi:hypothetical protein